MAIDLRQRYHSLRSDGGESLEFGPGYIVREAEGQRCSIMYAAHTSLVTNGMLKHKEPCTRLDLSFVSSEDIGEGSKEELLRAVQDGRIAAENQQFLTEAVSSNRVLYLRKAKGVLVINRKESAPEQLVDNHMFFATTQREEAISQIAQNVQSYTKSFLGLRHVDSRDILAIAAFIAIQLP